MKRILCLFGKHDYKYYKRRKGIVLTVNAPTLTPIVSTSLTNAVALGLEQMATMNTPTPCQPRQLRQWRRCLRCPKKEVV